MWIVYGVCRNHDCPDHILEDEIERKACNRQSRKRGCHISEHISVHCKRYECVRGQISAKRWGRMHRPCADLLQTGT